MAFGLSPWDPFREVDRLERLFRRTFEPLTRVGAELASPAIELTDEGDHYLVKAELPGVDEKDVEITLSGNILTVRGEKRYERRAGGEEEQAGGEKEAAKGEEQKAEGKKKKEEALERKEPAAPPSRPLFSEVFYGTYERTITLPDDIDPEKVEARSRNGVFWVEIGKKEAQRARRIEVTRH